jgi:glycine oxidase
MNAITIIGAGLIGRVLSCMLLARGAKVTLWDRQPLLGARGTGHLAGGMLAPYLESGHHDLLAMGLASIDLWRNLATELKVPEAVSQRGSLLTCFASEEAQFFDVMHKLQFRLGSTFAPQYIMPEDQRLRGFGLSKRLQKMAFFPQEAHLNNELLMDRMGEWLLRHPQLDFHHAQLQEQNLLKMGRPPLLVDCRGAAGVTGSRLPAPFPQLRGVRGEIAHVLCRGHGLTMPIRLVHPRFPLYLVPKSADALTIGATVIESADDGPFTVRSSLELLSALYAVLPAAGEAQITHLDVGVRAAYPDHMPKVFVQENDYSINGFYRHGFLLGPVFCQALADHLLDVCDMGQSMIKDHVIASFREETSRPERFSQEYNR